MPSKPCLIGSLNGYWEIIIKIKSNEIQSYFY